MLLFAAAGCARAPDATGPLTVAAAAGADAMLTDATAQGLVRFDASGQVEPGLAQRWIVIDDGLRYIFRLEEGVPAGQVADALRRRLSRRSDNPLLPYLSAVDQVVAMTPEVLEVQLSRPRPDLLKLFAQPGMGLRIGGRGTGPLREASMTGGPGGLLRPVPVPGAADEEDAAPGPPPVRLRPERAALALVRFAAGRADAVAGGTFADWPVAAATGLPDGALRRDPAAGLFGLAVTRRDGFLADPADRRALAAGLDRAAILAAVAPDWEAADRIVPERLDSAAPPYVPDWSLLDPAERLARLRARVRDWRAANGAAVRLRVALPAGPGATLLWGALAASLARAGIAAERVGPGAEAELALVDAVAPYDSARWYLATACRPCGAAAAAALTAARDAPDMGERGRMIAAADRLMEADAAFIPLARPFRWWAVGQRLTGWQPNARAAHPLNRLVADPS